MEPQSTYRRREVSEEETTPYCLAAKFPSERAAGRVYFQVQKLIDNPEADLSAYRLQLQGVWHAGEPVELPSDTDLRT
jgi:hypothetical protein